MSVEQSTREFIEELANRARAAGMRPFDDGSYAVGGNMKTRVHVYPWGDKWAVEEMTTWQAFLNDLKLFGLRMALHNLWVLMRWPK